MSSEIIYPTCRKPLLRATIVSALREHLHVWVIQWTLFAVTKYGTPLNNGTLNMIT